MPQTSEHKCSESCQKLSSNILNIVTDDIVMNIVANYKSLNYSMIDRVHKPDFFGKSLMRMKLVPM